MTTERNNNPVCHEFKQEKKFDLRLSSKHETIYKQTAERNNEEKIGSNACQNCFCIIILAQMLLTVIAIVTSVVISDTISTTPFDPFDASGKLQFNNKFRFIQ